MSAAEITPARLDEINSNSVDRRAMFYWQTDNGITMAERAVLFGSNRETIDEDGLIQQVNSALALEPGNAVVMSMSDRKLFTSQSHVNISGLAKLSNGETVVARFHPPGLRNGYFSAEFAIVKMMKNAGVAAVDPVLVHYAQDSDGLDFTLYKKVEGQDMKLYLAANPGDEDSLLVEAGETMAAIHQQRVDGFGYFDNERARKTGALQGLNKNYREHCLAALDSNLDDIVAADYVTKAQAEKIARFLRETNLFDIEQAVVVHNDFADWNIIVNKGKINAVIDWDEAHAGDPVADLACWSLFFHKKRFVKFLEGYKHIAALDDNFDEKLHLYRLRYLVSKLSLRNKVYAYNQNDHVKGLIESGLEALKDESEYFGL